MDSLTAKLMGKMTDTLKEMLWAVKLEELKDKLMIYLLVSLMVYLLVSPMVDQFVYQLVSLMV